MGGAATGYSQPNDSVPDTAKGRADRCGENHDSRLGLNSGHRPQGTLGARDE